MLYQDVIFVGGFVSPAGICKLNETKRCCGLSVSGVCLFYARRGLNIQVLRNYERFVDTTQIRQNEKRCFLPLLPQHIDFPLLVLTWPTHVRKIFVS